MFACLLAVAQNRGMDMRSVLEYNLGPIPLVLGTPGGCLAKANKAKILALLESDVAPADTVLSDSVWIVDGMAVLQAISCPPATFHLLADQVFIIAASSLQHNGQRADLRRISTQIRNEHHI